MKCENMLGKDFNSLAQRILYSYMAAYPDYIPIENDVSLESQKQIYDFIYEMLCAIYNNPELIGIHEESDGYYENWMMNNSNPKLMEDMAKIEKKFFDFCGYLVKIGRSGKIKDGDLWVDKAELSLTKSTKEKFEKLGIACNSTKEHNIFSLPGYPLAIPAWKMYSDNDDVKGLKTQRMMIFLYGRYKGKTYKVENLFGGLTMSRSTIKELEDYFASKGFQCTNDEPHSCAVRFAFVKWIKEYPKKEKVYMRAYFDWRKKDQLNFEFHFPGFRNMLNYYNEMDENLQTLIFNRTKICDGCGYCTQTDKSGKRQRLSLDLSLNGETLDKCPLYPNFVWNYIDENVIKDIQKLLAFSESILYHNS